MNGSVPYPQSEALGIYNTELFRALRAKAISALTRRRSDLLSLSRVIAGRKVCRQAYRGIRTIPIAAILGSESRCCDFDRCFRPLQSRTRERWLRIAQAVGRNEQLPPVSLIQVGDAYFVRDGHHRLSVAHALGQEYIEAEITVWQIAR